MDSSKMSTTGASPAKAEIQEKDQPVEITLSKTIQADAFLSSLAKVVQDVVTPALENVESRLESLEASTKRLEASNQRIESLLENLAPQKSNIAS